MVLEVLDGLEESRASTKLVRMALECGAGELEALRGCLYEGVRGLDLSQSYWFPVDQTSQIREVAPVVEGTITDLFRPEVLSDVIEGWLHTRLVVRKMREVSDNSGGSVTVDFPEAEIGLLNDRLFPSGAGVYGKRVLREEGRSGFLEPVEEFVVLQRFMRGALDGAFGDGFPIAKLVDLARETAEFVPMQRTVRWEPFEKEELVDELWSSGEDAQTAFLDAQTAFLDAQTAFLEWWRGRKSRLDKRMPLCDAVSN